jgi:phospholipase C
LSAWQLSFGYTLLQAQDLQNPNGHRALTPIKHVIIIVGENRTFDHIFATYKPVKGEHVDNLLSKEIIREDGSLGPNYSLAAQYSAKDKDSDSYQISPRGKTIYPYVPTNSPAIGDLFDLFRFY